MIEVTNQNFNKLYPHLEHTLKNASFIAIDGEFTGIEGDDAKNRLVCILLGTLYSSSVLMNVGDNASYFAVAACSIPYTSAMRTTGATFSHT